MKSNFKEKSRGSARTLRVGEQIRHILSQILSRGDFNNAVLHKHPVTVTMVTVSPDLRHAKAFIMPLGGGNTKDVLEALKSITPYIQHELAKADLRMKYLPKVKFYVDDSFDQAQKIEEMLSRPEVVRDLGAGTGGEDDGC